MVNEWMVKPELRGPVMGMMAAFGFLAEVMVTAKIVDAQALARLLQGKIDEWQHQSDPAASDAAKVLEILRAPLADPTREESHTLLNAEPKGRA